MKKYLSPEITLTKRYTERKNSPCSYSKKKDFIAASKQIYQKIEKLKLEMQKNGSYYDFRWFMQTVIFIYFDYSKHNLYMITIHGIACQIYPLMSYMFGSLNIQKSPTELQLL